MTSCCDAAADAALSDRFMDMKLDDASDPDCATIAKDILCAACSPSPVLSDPATSASLPLTCAGVAAAAATAAAAAAASLSIPAHGDPGSSIQEEGTVCLERISTGSSYVGLVPSPDGSGRAFVYNKDGKIWLASIPARGRSGAALLAVGDNPFLDLSGLVRHDAALGFGLTLMGVAFHREFASDGRVFVSYAARERCSASAAAGNDDGGGGSRPCQHHHQLQLQLVVAELTAAGSGGDHAMVRRIFTMRLPQLRTSPYSNNNHGGGGGGGQILVGPADGYLYLVTGHGGEEEADKMPFLGKVIRFDIDGPTPKPVIVAMGLRGPRGCSFDSDVPSHLYCANADQQGEQVHLIITNEGGVGSSARAPVILVVDHGLPGARAAPSILGGVVYRGSANPWLNGRYLYMYGSDAWAAMETPATDGRYAAARIPNVRCRAWGAPMPCAGGGGSVLALGEDNRRDAFAIGSGGIFRVAAPGVCGVPPQPWVGLAAVRGRVMSHVWCLQPI